MLPRKIYPQLLQAIDTPEIIVLNGMRRVGKTTLYRMLYDHIQSENKLFLDMENPIDQKLFEEEDYNNIMLHLQDYGIDKNKRAYIFLDEIQAIPQAVRAIKYLYDHYDVKFFLTGSSSFYLKNLFPESLAGRKFVYNLQPLDFEEYLIFQGIEKSFQSSFAKKADSKSKLIYEKYHRHYQQFVRYGGFPGVVLSPTAELKEARLKDIFKSYFEKDVHNIAHFREIRAFRDFILLLLRRVGAKVDVSKMAIALGVSRATIYSFLAFLEATFFITLVPQFGKSVDRTVSTGKKVYCCDTGFLTFFSDIDAGSVFENAVFLALSRYESVSYWQKKRGAEIDFIINNKVAVEVKQQGTSRDYKKLCERANELGVSENYIVSQIHGAEPWRIISVDL
jgi:predicted AAA+ superfamily ATPase